MNWYCRAQVQLLTLVLLAAWATAVSAQSLAAGKGAGRQARRQVVTQDRVEVVPKPEAKTPLTPQQQLKALFSEQERQLAFLGSGNPVAQMLVMRELNRVYPLSARQRAGLGVLVRDVQPQLVALRDKRARQERALEEAIYGENFDAKVIEQLTNESAETQKELMTRQISVESQVVRLLAQENRGQARYFLLLAELVIGPKRNQVPNVMLATKQYTGQWRLLQEAFGEDMEMIIPSFSNPLSVLLVMRQLELTPEQKTQFKALAEEARAALLAEREAGNGALRDFQGRNEMTPTERMAERLELRERIAAEAADRQAQAIKRQVRVETRIRQLLTPKQWNDYTMLLRAMLVGNLGRPNLPMAQPNLNKLRQQARPPFNNQPFDLQ